MSANDTTATGQNDHKNDPAEYRMLVDRMTLKFSGRDAALEHPFLEAYSFRSLTFIRFAIVMGAVLIGIFGFLDAYLLPQRAHLLWFIRYAVLCPAALLIALSTYRTSLVPFLPFLQSLLLILIASGFTVMIMISPAPVNSLYYSGIILVLIYGYTFLRLRFIWATLTGWIIVGIYIIAAMLDPDLPAMIITNNLFFLVSANVIGMFSSYSIEYHARNDYFLMTKMQHVQEKITETNRQLESLVKERTAELQNSVEQLQIENSERRMIEEALRASENNLKRGELIGKFGYWEYRIADGLFTLSEGARRIYGLSETLVPYAQIKDARLPKYHSLMDAAMHALITENAPYNVELEIRRADDGTVVAISIKAEYLAALNIVFGTTQDITERKQAESSLRSREEEYRMLFDSINDAVFISEISESGEIGTFIRVNDIACRQLGYSQDELLTMTPYDINAERESERVRSLIHNAASRSKAIIETEHRSKEGKTIPVEISTTVMQFNEKTILIANARDITERKMSEQALRQAQKLESIGTLAGGIAHDFNNLMNGVLGQSALALQKIPKESPAAGNIQKAIKASERVAELTKQLLAYSGRGKFYIVDIDLNAMVKENIQLLEVSIPKSTILEYKLSTPAPHILGDISQIQQVIMNLIINAGEAMGVNPGRIIISTTTRKITEGNAQYSDYTGAVLDPGTYAVLHVRDTGCGMSEETLSKIFDPFFSTKFTGRGLGLAAVLGIIKGHKGGLYIESREQEGTMFEIIFPLSKTEPVNDNLTTEPPLINGKDHRIMVIDDESIAIELIDDVLSEHHITVNGFVDPVNGIEYYRANYRNISFVILDYSMPVMDGKQVFAELKKINKDVKVLLCSGYSEEETMSVFGVERPAAFFPKPYKPAMLVKQVSELLSQ